MQWHDQYVTGECLLTFSFLENGLRFSTIYSGKISPTGWCWGTMQSLLLHVRTRPCAWISGQDTNVLDCDLMALSVLCSVSWLLWLVQSYIVMVVFLDPSLDGVTGLPLVHFTALTGHTLYFFWFRAQGVFILHRNQLSHPEDGGSKFLRSVGTCNHLTVQKPKRSPPE